MIRGGTRHGGRTWLGERIHGSVIVPSPRLRDQLTAALGEPLSAVLASAVSLGAAPVLDAVGAHVTQQPDPLPAGCTCDLCSSLRKFPAGPKRVYEWPLAEQRRRHVHERIDRAELPVTHVTRRTGRPYTFVLTKTDALFTDERNTRATATSDLEWLTARWPVTEEPHS